MNHQICCFTKIFTKLSTIFITKYGDSLKSSPNVSPTLTQNLVNHQIHHRIHHQIPQGTYMIKTSKRVDLGNVSCHVIMSEGTAAVQLSKTKQNGTGEIISPGCVRGEKLGYHFVGAFSHGGIEQIPIIYEKFNLFHCCRYV